MIDISNQSYQPNQTKVRQTVLFEFHGYSSYVET